MKVVVSGAKGFIGSNLLGALKGDYDFVSLDIDDFSKPGVVEAAFQNADVFIHLAGISSLAECEKDIYNAYKVNVALTGYLVDVFYKNNPQGRIIFASTGQVYDSCASLPLTEKSAVNPASTYARSKLAAEAVVGDLAKVYGGSSTILRFFNIAHKSQRPVFFLSSVFEQIQNSQSDRVTVNVGNVDIERDFSSIQDIIRVFNYCLKNVSSEKNEILNVSSGVPKTLRNIVTTMAKKMNKEAVINVDPARVREGEAKSHFGTSKFSSQLGVMTDGKSVDSFVDAFLSTISSS